MLHISLTSKHYGYLWVANVLAALIAMGEALVYLGVILDSVMQSKGIPFQYGCWFIGELIAAFVFARFALYWLKKYQGR